MNRCWFLLVKPKIFLKNYSWTQWELGGQKQSFRVLEKKVYQTYHFGMIPLMTLCSKIKLVDLERGWIQNYILKKYS